MRLTREVLRPPGAPLWRLACEEQVDQFCSLYPDGAEPTVEVLTECLAAELDVWWLLRLLQPRALVMWACTVADPDEACEHLRPARRYAAGEDVPLAVLLEARAAASAAWAAEAEAAWAAAAAAAWAAAAAAAAARAAERAAPEWAARAAALSAERAARENTKPPDLIALTHKAVGEYK